ncbi:MAG TPA: TIGR03960 family B12-binding radical SAM protein, partial [Polyangia bacterium]
MHPYADFLEAVERPCRYLGGEYLQVVKDPASVGASVALAFPDLYDVGMSHLGTKILYSLLNRDPRIAAERVFAPWPDLEDELRRRGLPLVSLETARPLRAFDVLGFSLQYELTYTNVLLMLDLGGVPLRAAARGREDPFVLAGGPVASHAEPLAPFIDAFFLGEAEEVLPALVCELAAGRRAGAPRQELLAELAARYPLYVPALYRVAPRADGVLCVAEPLDPRAPARPRRAVALDLDRFPFPDDVPVAHAEAIFDRAGVEIARGCTEGCRFCQAGMIYRPGRERGPDEVIDAVLRGVRRAGYDETSLTALSTADYSAIVPLMERLLGRLATEHVSLGLSSLRAYGLPEPLLAALAKLRMTGLTFAPEAGTQRLRDVISKNIAEADIEETARRVFGLGFRRMKLYFMLGLPTETEEDVKAIAQLAGRLLRVGRRLVRGAEITVSVSTHVPKPHTPFQWCAMDPLAEILRKQRFLRDVTRAERLGFKWHEAGMSVVEGVLGRGDRRVADVIEHAYRAGARFDGWDERFSLRRWEAAFAAGGVRAEDYLAATAPGDRLPWDHLDMRLEPAFLEEEYRLALRGRPRPPCGKTAGQVQHAASLEEARADDRPLVCYSCGVACDLDAMRARRERALTALGAERPAEPVAD